MMTYSVRLTDDAIVDLDNICGYISKNDGPEKAAHVFRQFKALFNDLKTIPKSGTIPQELLRVGIKEFRQFHFKPYRVIYQVKDNHVVVQLIADGRRNMSQLLERRLLQQ